MIAIQYLEKHDIIQDSDFCRPLAITMDNDGHADSYSTSNIYGGGIINNVTWLQVERANIDYFIGKTVGELNKVLTRKCLPPYEFIRGNIPTAVVCPLSDNESNEVLMQELRNITLTFGKYSGNTVGQLLDRNTADTDLYVDWLMNNHPSFSRYRNVTFV